MSHRALSLLEIALGIVLIGILTVLGWRLLTETTGEPPVGPIGATHNAMSNLDLALNVFKVETGKFPTTEQGLSALVVRPSEISRDDWIKCMLEIPFDGWQRPFLYRNPGKDGEDYALISVGKDGKEGTEDDITKESMKNVQ